jgi:hypothetical protein
VIVMEIRTMIDKIIIMEEIGALTVEMAAV